MSGFWEWFETKAEALGARAQTFRSMFEYLDTFQCPVTIIETGCTRDPENWSGDGCSTLLFDRYASSRSLDSRVFTVDLDFDACLMIQNLTTNTFVINADSVETLRDIQSHSSWPGGSPNLVYLDSFDFTKGNEIRSSIHHLKELEAILPLLRVDTLVVVDDSPSGTDGLPTPGQRIVGKGRFVAEYATAVGAHLKFSHYQVGWTGMTGGSEPETVWDLATRARAHVEAQESFAADCLYRLILQRTMPPYSERGARVAHGDACAFYAREALSKQRYGSAADWYRAALVADPLATDLRIELILGALVPMGSRDEALTEAQRAARISPDYPAVWHVLGGIYHEHDNIDKCIEAYDRQLDLVPDDPDALLDRATIAIDLGDYVVAKSIVNKVLTTDRRADAVHCWAMIAYRQGAHESAITLYDEALRLGCRDQPMTKWNQSLALHSIGLYKAGWALHDERRDITSRPMMALPMRRFRMPLLDEAALHGPPTRIHVHYEAGFGDNLCLVRYLGVLAALGHDVRFECHDALVNLVQRSFPNVKVMPRASNYPGAFGIPEFDYHLPTGSLPSVFGTEVHTIPWTGSYLKADPEIVAEYRQIVPAGSVGVCWSAGIRQGVWIQTYGKDKSATLPEMTRPLEGLRRRMVSLQVGPERKDIERFAGISVYDYLPDEPDWDHTAALVECLDAVVTVDTGVSHLAGGMGKPVFLAMHQHGSWHYMADRKGAPWQTRSPWYPTTNVYRKKDETWTGVFEAIAADL